MAATATPLGVSNNNQTAIARHKRPPARVLPIASGLRAKRDGTTVARSLSSRDPRVEHPEHQLLIARALCPVIFAARIHTQECQTTDRQP